MIRRVINIDEEKWLISSKEENKEESGAGE